MSALAISIVVASAVAVGGLLGFVLGRGWGREDGRAEEWCDKYFAEIARDKARRDASGRFKSKHT